jgi:hypothetical protein
MLIHAIHNCAVRGHHWMEQRLSLVLQLLPQELVPYVLLLRAEWRCWPELSDYKGQWVGRAVGIHPDKKQQLRQGSLDLSQLLHRKCAHASVVIVYSYHVDI